MTVHAHLLIIVAMLSARVGNKQMLQ